MTIDRLTDAVTKLHNAAKTFAEIQNNVDILQRIQISLLSMRDELEALTDILENEFHDVLINEVMKDD